MAHAARKLTVEPVSVATYTTCSYTLEKIDVTQKAIKQYQRTKKIKSDCANAQIDTCPRLCCSYTTEQMSFLSGVALMIIYFHQKWLATIQFFE